VQWISNSNDITGTSPGLTTWTIGNRIGGISLIFFYGVLATLLLYYIYEYTSLGAVCCSSAVGAASLASAVCT